LETKRRKNIRKEEIVGTREEEKDRPNSQSRKKKKPLQKKDDKSKGLKEVGNI
jgi:hypothetical protein